MQRRHLCIGMIQAFVSQAQRDFPGSSPAKRVASACQRSKVTGKREECVWDGRSFGDIMFLLLRRPLDGRQFQDVAENWRVKWPEHLEAYNSMQLEVLKLKDVDAILRVETTGR